MSVIKSVLMLERETILPLANFEQVNPEIDVHGLGLGVCTQRVKYPPYLFADTGYRSPHPASHGPEAKLNASRLIILDSEARMLTPS